MDEGGSRLFFVAFYGVGIYSAVDLYWQMMIFYKAIDMESLVRTDGCRNI